MLHFTHTVEISFFDPCTMETKTVPKFVPIYDINLLFTNLIIERYDMWFYPHVKEHQLLHHTRQLPCCNNSMSHTNHLVTFSTPVARKVSKNTILLKLLYLSIRRFLWNTEKLAWKLKKQWLGKSEPFSPFLVTVIENLLKMITDLWRSSSIPVIIV